MFLKILIITKINDHNLTSGIYNQSKIMRIITLSDKGENKAKYLYKALFKILKICSCKRKHNLST